MPRDSIILRMDFVPVETIGEYNSDALKVPCEAVVSFTVRLARLFDLVC